MINYYTNIELFKYNFQILIISLHKDKSFILKMQIIIKI